MELYTYKERKKDRERESESEREIMFLPVINMICHFIILFNYCMLHNLSYS